MLRTLAVPAIMYALMLFVPGYLLLRCTRLPRAWAICCAPVISTAAVGVLGELYAAAGIDATPVTVFLPAVLVPLVALALLEARKARRSTGDASQPRTPLAAPAIPWWMPVAFALVGLAICNNLFVSELPRANSIVQNYDVQHHLNTIRAFFDARRISSLGVSSYLAPVDASITPFGRPSYYPAIWYGQCALLMQATGLSAPVAINVSLAVTLGLAYPLAMCAFAATVFEGAEHGHEAGFAALTCVGFAMFPWCLLIFGPLYPNLVGFCLMPASMSLCMHAFRAQTSRDRIVLWVASVAALAGQALLHPNTLFSMFVILVPFVAQLVWQASVGHGLGRPRAALATLGFLLVCLAFWTACFKAPAFAAAINELWPYYAYPWQEVVNILTQTYTLFFFSEVTAQVLVGALVVIGLVVTVYDPPTRWLCVSYGAICVICFVAATSTNDTLKRFLGGFWYTDAMRLTAMAIVVAALLAARGLGWAYDRAVDALEAYNGRMGRRTHPAIAACVISACFLVLNFMPGFNWPGAHSELSSHIDEYRFDGHEYDSNSVKTTFGDYRQLLRDAYAYMSPIDVHEDAFLEEVRAIVGDDLVINNPYDGSTLVYGAYGIRTYYRRANGYGGDSETAQSLSIREGLCNIATDDAVRQAVADTGARYVLVLDAENSATSFLRIRSKVSDGAYDGIAAITTDTPGFTEVLGSGSCHLYLIDEA